MITQPRGPPRIAGLVGGQIPQQRGLDREYGVTVDVLALPVEDVRRYRPVARGAHDHVDVRWPPGMPPGRCQHVADRPVVRDRVGGRPDREERVTAVVPGEEPPAQVVLWRLRVLDGVKLVVAV